MTIRASVYIAASLDGFIARPDGSVDWLNDTQALLPEGEDLGFGAFMDTVDTLIMGRKTFEQVLSFGVWPYGQTPVVVLSHGPINIPPDLVATVSQASGSPRDILERLTAQGVQHVYVDGGNTIQGFLAESLIDQITITTIPVILGHGIPLFGRLEGGIKLTHVKTVADFGLVQTTYRIEKDG
jgi:dihydrofolate reductase